MVCVLVGEKSTEKKGREKYTMILESLFLSSGIMNYLPFSSCCWEFFTSSGSIFALPFKKE